jgi:hypothetical protein
MGYRKIELYLPSCILLSDINAAACLAAKYATMPSD